MNRIVRRTSSLPRAIHAALVMAVTASTAGIASGQSLPQSVGPRWEYGQFEWVRDVPAGPEVARWTVGDSVVVSTRSLDNMVELVSGRRSPKTETQHTFFAWLGATGWEMVSCHQVEPTSAVRTLSMTCWFKRRLQ